MQLLRLRNRFGNLNDMVHVLFVLLLIIGTVSCLDTTPWIVGDIWYGRYQCKERRVFSSLLVTAFDNTTASVVVEITILNKESKYELRGIYDQREQFVKLYCGMYDLLGLPSAANYY